MVQIVILLQGSTYQGFLFKIHHTSQHIHTHTNTHREKEYYLPYYCTVECVVTHYYHGEQCNVLKNELHSSVLNSSISGY